MYRNFYNIKIEKKNKLQLELKEKLIDEERLRQEAEVNFFVIIQLKCKNLEKEEIEILRRLKTTTQVHKEGR